MIDFREGTVLIDGPITKEEKAELDLWADRKNDFIEELEFFTKQLRNAKTQADREFFNKEIAQTNKVLGIIAKIMPD